MMIRKLKKISALFMIVIMITGLFVGCGTEEDVKKENDRIAENGVDVEEEDNGIEVERGLFDVSVTIPPGMVTADETENLKEETKEPEDVKIIENEDGSLTYKMSRAIHNKMMTEIRKDINSYVEEVLESTDFPTVKDIECDDSLTSVTITVTNEEEFKSGFDGFIIFGIGLQAMFYQAFDGVDSDNLNVVIDVKDQETGDIFDTVTYPEDLEVMDEELE